MRGFSPRGSQRSGSRTGGDGPAGAGKRRASMGSDGRQRSVFCVMRLFLFVVVAAAVALIGVAMAKEQDELKLDADVVARPAIKEITNNDDVEAEEEEEEEEEVKTPAATTVVPEPPKPRPLNEEYLEELKRLKADATKQCDESLDLLYSEIVKTTRQIFAARAFDETYSTIFPFSVAVASCGSFRDQIALLTQRLCDPATANFHVTCDPTDKTPINGTLTFPLRVTLRKPGTPSEAAACACTLSGHTHFFAPGEGVDPRVGTPGYGAIKQQQQTGPAPPAASAPAKAKVKPRKGAHPAKASE